MTILQIYGGAIKIGGHFRSGLAMAKGFTAKGHKVIAIAPGTTLEMKTAFEKAGVALQILPLVGRRIKIPCTAGWQQIVTIAAREKVNIIHAMDFASIARSYLAAIKLETGFLCTQSGGDRTSSPPPTKETVVIFSEEQQNIYSSIYKHPRSQTKVISARIDADYYHPLAPPADFMQRHKLDHEGLKIGIATRLESSKSHNINALIDFAKNHTSPEKIHIYVVGEGDLREPLQSQAEQIENETAVVHFLGPIHSITEINQFYNACDVIAGSGRGIMEAMACHKPVIITGKNGEAQLLGPDNIIESAAYNFSGRHFQQPSLVPTLAEVLTSINRNPSQLIPAADFCFKYFIKHLTASVGVDQLQEVCLGIEPSSTMLDFIKWYTLASGYTINAVLKYKLSRLHGFWMQAIQTTPKHHSHDIQAHK